MRKLNFGYLLMEKKKGFYSQVASACENVVPLCSKEQCNF